MSPGKWLSSISGLRSLGAGATLPVRLSDSSGTTLPVYVPRYCIPLTSVTKHE